MNDQPDISIIVPTRDRERILSRTVDAVLSSTNGLKAELIIVNDSKSSEVKLKNQDARILIVNNPKSGVASARNLGAGLARSELLLFIDDDILATSEAIEKALKGLREHPNWCVNPNWRYPDDLLEKINRTQFGRYLSHYGFTTLKGWNKDEPWSDQTLFESSGLASYFLPVTKKKFDAVHGYDERYPHAGQEDHDFSHRLRQSGVKTYIDPTTFVFHNEADRAELTNWLERKKRNGETRRVGFEKGYTHLNLDYGPIKRTIYNISVKIQPFTLLCLKLIPNLRIFDPLYFRMINILLGTAIWEGFNRASK